jgi:lipopolysaccharide biosynthesis protein
LSDVIAFYLPQFHPIPENDLWWGKGFTEWRNVALARPRFRGHRQPRFPTDLGFYDLRVPESRAAQAALARAHGITAFCYYHYWFNGRRLLQRPFDAVLESGEPDFPFLLCWANENWTRRWDGRESDVLMSQSYSTEDDRAHLRVLARAFDDSRYVRFQGRPTFLVYRPELLPSPIRTADVWREEAHRLGIGDILLGRVEALSWNSDPRDIGFDFSVEFAPRWDVLKKRIYGRRPVADLRRRGMIRDVYTENRVFAYDDMVTAMLGRPESSYPLLRCACPTWDNTPRRETGATLLVGSTPAAFGRWVTALLERRGTFGGEPAPVFVNAWNEWAEGAQLEPCSVFGRGYLEALRDAVASTRSASG